jgi:hypothetical protein
VETTPAYRIYACGDEAITIAFGKDITAYIKVRLLDLYILPINNRDTSYK